MTAVDICVDRLDRTGAYAGRENDNVGEEGDKFRQDCVQLAQEEKYEDLRVRIESDAALQGYLRDFYLMGPLTPDEIRFCIGFAAGADASARKKSGTDRDKHVKKVIADRKKGPPGG